MFWDENIRFYVNAHFSGVNVNIYLHVKFVNLYLGSLNLHQMEILFWYVSRLVKTQQLE